MTITLTTDLVLGIGALIVAAVAIILFVRATDSTKKTEEFEATSNPVVVNVASRKVKVPDLQTVTQKAQVDLAHTQIRTLTLKQEILSMVMKRLFEAEDNSEISRTERERLSKNYEAEIQQVNEQLKRAELIVSLNELESIRTNIIEQFQQTLTNTQSQIDLIIKELNIPQPEPELEKKAEPTKPQPVKRRRPRPQPQEYEEEPEEEEEDEDAVKGKRDTVEDRLDKLKQDVLKELEELERLELEQ